MSGALARLRALFGDPLFTRTAGGVVPTERARDLREPVAELLARAAALLEQPAGLRPSALDATVTIQAGSDYLARLLLPALARELGTRAPGVRLNVLPPNPRVAARLLTEGQADIGVGYLPDPPETLHRTALFRDGWAILARRGHPCGAASLEASAYAAAGHVDVSPSGARHYSRLVDRALSRAGVQRRIVLTVPGFMTVAPIVAETELLATVPARVAALARGAFPVAVLQPPVEIAELEISLYWHERSHRDPLHRWLRSLVRECGTRAV
jgi:DNA-binding transcriptional LysR family regulator